MNRIIVLIAGPAGSGKSFLARRVATTSVFKSTCIISTDWYYKSHQENYDVPDAVNLERLTSDVSMLGNGEEVTLQYHAHDDHGTVRLSWDHALIVEGLFAFSVRRSDYPTFCIYVDTNLYLAGGRRALRDALVYGDSAEIVLERIERAVIPSIEQSVIPQRAQADFVYRNETDWTALINNLSLLGAT